MRYEPRRYRQQSINSNLVHFRIVVKETDVDIAVRPEVFSPELVLRTEQLIRAERAALEAYIARDKTFLHALEPYKPLPGAPDIARDMAAAAALCNVGPMAAVAGAFADRIGKALVRHSRDVVVENGGDIFLRSTRKRVISIFAGASPFSNRIGLEIPPYLTPLGVCTSSGTIGPSLSFGRADAVVVVATTATLADAVATAAANRVRSPADIEAAVAMATDVPGVIGAIAIVGDKLAVKGELKLVPLAGTG